MTREDVSRLSDDGHGRRSSGWKNREKIQTDPRLGACSQSPSEEISVGG